MSANNAQRTPGMVSTNYWTTGRITIETPVNPKRPDDYVTPIAEMFPQIDRETMKANAAYIKLAWNSHDRLVAALHNMLLACGMAAMEGEPLRTNDSACVSARALIAEIEAGEVKK